MQHKKKFKITPVGVAVTVILTDDIKATRAGLSEMYGFPECLALTGALGLFTCDFDIVPGECFILLALDPRLNHLAHECVHCAEAIDSHYGINSEEFRCYTTGYLVEEIARFISKIRDHKS